MSIHVKTAAGWEELGVGALPEPGLPGLGGWAEITAVSGSPKRYAYNDGPGGVGGFDWVAFEWTQDGSVTTTDGLVDVFVVSGGGASIATTGLGAGARITAGLEHVMDDTHEVIIAQPTTHKDLGEPSFLGSITSGWSPRVYGGAGATTSQLPGSSYGLVTHIKGFEDDYGRDGRHPEAPRPNHGDGAATSSTAGTSGCVLARVPAAQAAGVDPGSWVTRIDYYAEVTDGIVTDLYQERFYGDDTVRTENGRYASPEQPDDLIPCDANVAEGWTYLDGEFTPPPPDPSWREEAIKALQEQLKDLQKDT